MGMVVGSLAVRARLDEPGAGGSGGGGSGGLRLVCSSELAEVCDALRPSVAQVSVEPAGVTADRLASEPDDAASLDGWLVPTPWPEIVRAARQRAGLAPSLESGPVLARSPLVLAASPGRAQLLGQRCPGGQPTWRCWGDLAVQGQLKPGHADMRDALGVAAVGAATASFFQNRPDLARADLEENDEYRSWLRGLERSVNFRFSAGSPLRDMLLKGPVDFDAVATTEAEAGPLIASAVRPDKPMVIYPSPVATLDVVLATVPGRAKRLSQAAGGDTGLDALARSGWRVPNRRAARGVASEPPLPGGNGLPEPGVLDFLRTLSEEVAR